MKLRLGLLFSAAALSATATTTARADDKAATTAACLAASSDGQTLRDVHKMIEARDKFRQCAQESCPGAVRHDCIEWANGLEQTIPSVVLSLKDAAGRDVLDAKVTMDGQPLADALSGAAIPIDPGPHSFRFDRADGTTASQQLVVGEGQRNIVVAARFTDPRARGAGTWRTVGWVVGGVGVAGLAVGGIFGGLAVSDKGSADCNAANKCTHFASVASAKTSADIADVGFIAGGVLAAAGATLLILNWQSGPQASSGWVTVTPSIAESGGGLMLRGSF